MKLASALSERGDLQVRLRELETRLVNNAKTQEGEPPAERPEDLLAELNRMTARLEHLVARINLTNASTVSGGVTITEMIAKKDVLRMKTTALRRFLDEASNKTDRYSKSEILVVSTVDVPTVQKHLDELSRELRLLDERIQELNWTTELIE